jgi:Spy/CpxP family protein refolding chaperone
MLVRAFALGAIAVVTPTAIMAQHSPYAHHADRAVTSLSDEDVADILAGEGASLALPAELNRFPGPKHVLELADSFAVTQTQRGQVEREFAAMRDAAQRVGRLYVDAERALDSLFRSTTVNEASLRAHLQTAEAHRAELRSIHLMAHVRVLAMLTDQQVHAYQRLRGYH